MLIDCKCVAVLSFQRSYSSNLFEEAIKVVRHVVKMNSFKVDTFAILAKKANELYVKLQQAYINFEDAPEDFKGILLFHLLSIHTYCQLSAHYYHC